MYVYACGCVLPGEGPCGGQRGHWFPQSWSYRWSWAWVLRIELGSPQVQGVLSPAELSLQPHSKFESADELWRIPAL